jgi:hypothetical protein
MKNPSSSKGTTPSKNLNKKLQKISKVQKNAKKKIFFFNWYCFWIGKLHLGAERIATQRMSSALNNVFTVFSQAKGIKPSLI